MTVVTSRIWTVELGAEFAVLAVMENARANSLSHIFPVFVTFFVVAVAGMINALAIALH